MTGAAKLRIGRIHLVMPKPDVSHMTISESRYQRVSVSSTVKKIVSDKIAGKKRIKLKPSIVVSASLGMEPLAAFPTRKPARCATTIPIRIRNKAVAE